MCSEILLNSIVEQINKFIRAYYTQEKRFKSIYKQDIEFPGKIRLVLLRVVDLESGSLQRLLSATGKLLSGYAHSGQKF